jgi:hypothetical protein
MHLEEKNVEWMMRMLIHQTMEQKHREASLSGLMAELKNADP